jgi:hypothetical protein
VVVWLAVRCQTPLSVTRSHALSTATLGTGPDGKLVRRLVDVANRHAQGPSSTKQATVAANAPTWKTSVHAALLNAQCTAKCHHGVCGANALAPAAAVCSQEADQSTHTTVLEEQLALSWTNLSLATKDRAQWIVSYRPMIHGKLVLNLATLAAKCATEP